MRSRISACSSLFLFQLLHLPKVSGQPKWNDGIGSPDEYWGAINLALAGIGYYGARGEATDLSESLKKLESSKRIGLDLAYMATGVYLVERSRNASDDNHADQLGDFGKSIMLQGGFLFAFDLVMYFVLQNHGKKNLYKTL